jgi:hypothetical protein
MAAQSLSRPQGRPYAELYPALGILLSPMLAAAAMSLSSVSVIGNALRLRHAKDLSPEWRRVRRSKTAARPQIARPIRNVRTRLLPPRAIQAGDAAANRRHRRRPWGQTLVARVQEVRALLS